MRIGSRIYVFYDARPFTPNVQAFVCEVSKQLKTGFKVKNIDNPGEYEDAIFRDNGTARGWNTLSWADVRDMQARRDYDTLRAWMVLEKEAKQDG